MEQLPIDFLLISLCILVVKIPTRNNFLKFGLTRWHPIAPMQEELAVFSGLKKSRNRIIPLSKWGFLLQVSNHLEMHTFRCPHLNSGKVIKDRLFVQSADCWGTLDPCEPVSNLRFEMLRTWAGCGQCDPASLTWRWGICVLSFH